MIRAKDAGHEDEDTLKKLRYEQTYGYAIVVSVTSLSRILPDCLQWDPWSMNHRRPEGSLRFAINNTISRRGQRKRTHRRQAFAHQHVPVVL